MEKERILLVDDEINSSIVMQSLVQYFEKQEIFALSKCESVEEAKLLLEKYVYDLVVLDIMMGHKALYDISETKGGLETGVRFLKDLRDGKFNAINKDTIVIVYTNARVTEVQKVIGANYINISLVPKPKKMKILEEYKMLKMKRANYEK